jgi:hypothetical protein
MALEAGKLLLLQFLTGKAGKETIYRTPRNRVHSFKSENIFTVFKGDILRAILKIGNH